MILSGNDSKPHVAATHRDTATTFLDTPGPFANHQIWLGCAARAAVAATAVHQFEAVLCFPVSPARLDLYCGLVPPPPPPFQRAKENNLPNAYQIYEFSRQTVGDRWALSEGRARGGFSLISMKL
jgi:hypothetical protein